jgi:hypothetical protein
MGTDPLAISALTICGVAWLLAAVLLTLDLLGRLPSARKRSVRAYRLQLTAGLVLMTTVMLSQIATQARWAVPARLAISILTIVAALGTLVVAIKAAAMHSETKMNLDRPESETPS